MASSASIQQILSKVASEIGFGVLKASRYGVFGLKCLAKLGVDTSAAMSYYIFQV